MRDIITDLQKSNTWKIQLTIGITFFSSKDTKEERAMHSNGNNENLTNEAVDELFFSLSSRCQDNLQTSLRGSEFIFDSVQVMYYKCHDVVVHILTLHAG